MPPVGLGPASKRCQRRCILASGPSPTFGRDSADDSTIPSSLPLGPRFLEARGMLGGVGFDAQARSAARFRPSFDKPIPRLRLPRSPSPCPGRIIHRPLCAAPHPSPRPLLSPSGHGFLVSPRAHILPPSPVPGLGQGGLPPVTGLTPLSKHSPRRARPALSDTPAPGGGWPGSLSRRCRGGGSLGEAIVIPHTLRGLLQARERAWGPTRHVMSAGKAVATALHLSSQFRP
jgi:hypothetical protein